jgi:hypothetical protein
MKLMTLTAMIDAAHGQSAGPATVTGAFSRHQSDLERSFRQRRQQNQPAAKAPISMMR